MEIIDKNQQVIKNGDIINIHQTVNGQNLFVVLNTNPLDIRYAHDLNYLYQYDKEELFKPCHFSGETEIEIVANIYNLIPKISY